MSDYRDFDSIKTLTRVYGTLINETPLRVGAGEEPPLGSSVDITVYRINGKPYIPGSSLKGVLRSLAELIAKSRGENIHYPWDEGKIEEEDNKKDFCVICGIFGNTKLASHIRVYDATPKDANSAKTFIKYGIAIDREFGTVRSGPFQEEFILPKVKWEFKMDILNIKVFSEPIDKRGEIIKSLIDMMRNPGIQVGARKSIGAGLMRLEKLRYEVYELKNGKFELTDKGEIS